VGRSDAARLTSAHSTTIPVGRSLLPLAAACGVGVKMASPEFLDTKAAAVFCGISADTLVTKRVRGGGPPFRRPNGTRRVVYAVTDLREWLGARRASTSDDGQEAGA